VAVERREGAGRQPGAKGTYPALTASGCRYLRIRQVAEMLGLSTSTLYGLCVSGALPYVRTTANSIRISLDDLHAFVDARKAGHRRDGETVL